MSALLAKKENVPRRSPSLCVFGCAPDTGNLGVSALSLSTVLALKREAPDAAITVFDHGRGRRSATAFDGDDEVAFALAGAYYTRRFYRSGSLWNVRNSVRWGGLGNPGAEALLAADAILDLSGGDSFTDLYGAKRFRTIVYPKLLALDNEIPLVLLPQTYGPFEGARSRRVATRIVRGASAAWARDERSFEALKDLLGADFDPQRHHSGIDMALQLPARAPDVRGNEPLWDWLMQPVSEPLVGLNVSGLLYNDPREATGRYGFKADYREIISTIVRRFLDSTPARVLLVPHVRDSAEHNEGDFSACRAVLQLFPGHANARLRVLDWELGPSEAKYVISRVSWFCGTRMHSAIAAVSSGVPTAAISYSGKTLGVFESCGQGEHVADPRHLDTPAVCEQIWRSWGARARARDDLRDRLPRLLHACRLQTRSILDACAVGR